MQVFHIPELHVDNEAIEVRLPVNKAKIVDIRSLFADQRADPAEDPGIVGNREVEAHVIDRLVGALVPAKVDPALGLIFELFERGAVDGVDDNALAAIGDADDAFARDRLAAGGTGKALFAREADNGMGGLDLVPLLPGQVGIEGFHDLAGRDLGGAELGEEFLGIAEAHVFRRGPERLVGDFLAHMFEGHAGKFLAELDEALAVFLAEAAADGGLGAAGGDDVDPGGLGALALGRHDLHRLAVLEAGPEGDADAVDLGADAAVADPGVDRVGEVEGGGAAGEFDHFALGGEAEHLVGIHLHPDVFEELVVVVAAFEAFGERGHPGRRVDGKRVFHPDPVAVGPVGGHPGLGHLVHLAGADLDFHALAVAPRYGGVDRAVAVGLGLADIVLEAARDGAPALVNGAEDGIAVLFRLGDDAEAVDVGETREPLVLFLHLAPDRIGFLGAAIDIRFYPELVEFLAHVAGDLLHHIARFALERDEAAHDGVAAFGVEDPERQILKLVTHPLHAHPAGEGGVDIHRLARFLDLLFGAHGFDGAHVVQAVGELDENHPQVLRHGEEELAEVFRLLRFGRRELEVGQLGDAIHKFRDVPPEAVGDFAVGGPGVFDRVVEKCGDDGGIVEVHLGQDRSDRDRMGEIGFAGMAELPVMHLAAIVIGGADQAVIRLRIVVADQFDQVFGVDHPVRPWGREAPLSPSPALPSAHGGVFLRSCRLRPACLPGLRP